MEVTAAVVAAIGTTVAVLTMTEASVLAAAASVETTAVWIPERAPVASDPAAAAV